MTVLQEIAWVLSLLVGILYVVGIGSFDRTVIALLMLLSVQIGLLSNTPSRGDKK